MIGELHYLAEIEVSLRRYADQVRELGGRDKGARKKLADLVTEAVQFEVRLRKESGIGSRFIIIQQQLLALQKARAYDASTDPEQILKISEKSIQPLADDEMIVYVDLINAQGKLLSTWQKMLVPRALREHSVNRPIYADFSHIEELVRSKKNPISHGFIEAVINKADILVPLEECTCTGPLGHPLLRLKQGALLLKNVRFFYHLDKKYRLSAAGELTLVQASVIHSG